MHINAHNADNDVEAFEVLSASERRQILVRLREHSSGSASPLPIEDLIEERDDPRRSKLQLHHVHLPKLADAGYIEWDVESGLISRGPSFESIMELLKLFEDHG